MTRKGEKAKQRRERERDELSEREGD